MGSQDRDISWIQVQLTVTKWHLDDAMNAVADGAAHKLQRAKLAYLGMIRSLSQAKLTSEERQEIERELSELRSSWELRVPRLPRDAPPDTGSEEAPKLW